MKPFRFNLESVLEARRMQESEVRIQLSALIENQQLAIARCQEAAHALNLIVQAISSESSTTFSVDQRGRSWAMRQAQEKICAELNLAAQECARLTEEKRAELLEARRKCELLESLKADRRTAWNKEAERAGQHQLDEFAMTRRHQAAQQEYALC